MKFIDNFSIVLNFEKVPIRQGHHPIRTGQTPIREGHHPIWQGTIPIREPGKSIGLAHIPIRPPQNPIRFTKNCYPTGSPPYPTGVKLNPVGKKYLSGWVAGLSGREKPLSCWKTGHPVQEKLIHNDLWGFRHLYQLNELVHLKSQSTIVEIWKPG